MVLRRLRGVAFSTRHPERLTLGKHSPLRAVGFGSSQLGFTVPSPQRGVGFGCSQLGFTDPSIKGVSAEKVDGGGRGGVGG